MSQPCETHNRTRTILLLNGPNLNLLGTREPHIYGYTTLADVEAQAAEQARRHGIRLETFQSNHEGALIDRVHAEREGEGRVDAIVVNAGALTHTSVGLRDALVGVALPFVEVHVSNVYRREPFRHHSYLSDKAEAVVVGLGVHGYAVAIEHLARMLQTEDTSIGGRVAEKSRL